MITSYLPSTRDVITVLMQILIILIVYLWMWLSPKLLKAIYVVVVETLIAHYLVKLIRKMFEKDTDEYDYSDDDDEDSQISDASYLDDSSF
ncbi:hypothetical protein B9Z55_003558 [Caenorhabditis nigoni]|uniref:Uncharacterized protein n=1 Tax=Caenorhabditis nigoni TaxID=1611254 RepID=A0A2G5VQZ8_9PELO|nr:hypothetical protein B9Z55_003558 [Caenorhabditis nigoni]